MLHSQYERFVVHLAAAVALSTWGWSFTLMSCDREIIYSGAPVQLAVVQKSKTQTLVLAIGTQIYLFFGLFKI